jgi:hypothetical protein
MGFIGYRREQPEGVDAVVRIYLECRETPVAASTESSQIACGDAVDVLFPSGGGPCKLRGVDGVLVLKKFYKLLFSLEERAREHGNDWRSVMSSPGRLLEHLRYTRNARDFTGQDEPQCVARSGQQDEPECAAVSRSD